MATHNSINTSVYKAIDPSNFTNKFKGKVVLVTGAGRGIGQGIAIAFARAGATLALLDLKKENLASTVKQCEELGSKVLPIACNVADTADVDAAFDEIEEKLGQIDVLVNNAGTNYRKPYHMMKFDDFWKVIEVNFKAPMYLMHKILPKFRKRHEGCIINIASRSGTVNSPMGAQYASGKAALIRAVGCLQEELILDGEDNIHIYALHPGGVLTGLQSDFEPDVKEMYPELTKKWAAWYKTFATPAAVPGQTCVYLATGAGKDVLKGRYFDCEQDIDFVVRQGRAKLEKEDLYNLKVTFIGLANDGGTAPAEWEEGNRQ